MSIATDLKLLAQTIRKYILVHDKRHDLEDVWRRECADRIDECTNHIKVLEKKVLEKQVEILKSIAWPPGQKGN